MLKSVKKCYVVVVVVLLLVLYVPNTLIPILERYLVITHSMQQVDALVVMAGSPQERLPAAVKLYQEGKARKILLANDGMRSAWSQDHQRNLYEVEWAEVDLLKHKIPAEAIVKLPYSSSGTIFDALHAVSFARKQEMRSLLVVTSDYHTRRTFWCFQQAANNYPVTLGVYPVSSAKKSEMKLRRFYILACEFLKNLYYLWRYDPEWVGKCWTNKAY